MPNDQEHFVGIDVSKDWFDVAILWQKATKPGMDNSKLCV